MVIPKNINVSANFDSGTLWVHKNSISYNCTDASIQDRYNLSFNDFEISEALIATTVEQYLKVKEK